MYTYSAGLKPYAYHFELYLYMKKKQELCAAACIDMHELSAHGQPFWFWEVSRLSARKRSG